MGRGRDGFGDVFGAMRGSGRADDPFASDRLEVTTTSGQRVWAVLDGEGIRFEYADGSRPQPPAGWPLATTKTPAGRQRLLDAPGVGDSMTLSADTVEAVCAWADARRPGEVITDAAELDALQAQPADEEHAYGRRGRIARMKTTVLWHGEDPQMPMRLAYRLPDTDAARQRFRQLCRRPPDS